MKTYATFDIVKLQYFDIDWCDIFRSEIFYILCLMKIVSIKADFAVEWNYNLEDACHFTEYAKHYIMSILSTKSKQTIFCIYTEKNPTSKLCW